MKLSEVPQDAAILDSCREIAYAVDEQGRYVLTPSAGWGPANLANLQAWRQIAEEMAAALQQVRAGQASPLLFHMVRQQMDVALLARYVHLPRWRVRRHLSARHYPKLSAALKERYAAVFRLSSDELERLPERVELPVELPDSEEESP